MGRFPAPPAGFGASRVSGLGGVPFGPLRAVFAGRGSAGLVVGWEGGPAVEGSQEGISIERRKIMAVTVNCEVLTPDRDDRYREVPISQAREGDVAYFRCSMLIGVDICMGALVKQRDNSMWVLRCISMYGTNERMVIGPDGQPAQGIYDLGVYRRKDR